MALDVKILESGRGGDEVFFGSTWPDPVTVEGEYALVQRIVKCLLTEPGEDQFDPDWGGGLASAMLGIAGQERERANRAASSAIGKVLRDLLSSQPSEPEGRLVALRLRAITYDEQDTSWVLDVDVETEARLFQFSTATG